MRWGSFPAYSDEFWDGLFVALRTLSHEDYLSQVAIYRDVHLGLHPSEWIENECANATVESTGICLLRAELRRRETL